MISFESNGIVLPPLQCELLCGKQCVQTRVHTVQKRVTKDYLAQLGNPAVASEAPTSVCRQAAGLPQIFFYLVLAQAEMMRRRCKRILKFACVQLALWLGVEAHVQTSGASDSSLPYRFLRIGILARLQAYAKKETHDEHIENWVIISLFIVVITCSIVFEVLLGRLEGYLHRRRLHKLQDMLDCAFKELTILGFISLFLYSTIRLGYMRQLNDKYLGVSKTEEAAIVEAEAHGEEPYPPTHLTETFESIHILIFMIMVTFILQAAALTAVGYKTMRKLEYMDAKTDGDLRSDVSALLGHGHQDEQLIRDALEHWGVRRRFISATNPLMPKPRRPEPGRPQFSFAAYLIHCFGESLAEMIELPPSILILTLLIVVLLRPALSLPGRDVIVFMIIGAFGLLFLTYTAYSFLKFADAKIRPDSGSLMALFASSVVDPSALDEALHCPIDDRPLATVKEWPRRHVVNRAAALFPFGNPRYFKRLLQLLLFFHAAYTAVLLMCYLALERGSQYVWWANGYWSYPLTLIPLCCSFLVWTWLLRAFTTVFHVDFLARASTIRLVEAEQDKVVVQRDDQYLEYLMHQGGKVEHATSVQLQSLLASYSRLPREAQAYIQSLFKCLATHPERFPHAEAPGVMSKQAIEDVIRCTRTETTSSQDARTFAEDWFRIIDSSRSGYLQFDGFKAFVVLLGSLGVDPKQYPQYQRARLGKLFEYLDVDGDQRISLAELEEALSGMKPPISSGEILSLQQRISEDGVNITKQSLFAWARRTRMRSHASVVQEE